MSKKKATTILATAGLASKNGRWDSAIADAEGMIGAAERYTAGMRESIKTFKELRDTGEPFPGTFESADGVMGQHGDMGQSPRFRGSRFEVRGFD